MRDIVIQVDDVWKKYRLGVLGTGTLRHDFNRWCHRLLGKPDPYAKVNEVGSQGLEAGSRISELGSRTSDSRQPPSELSSEEMWALRGVSFEVKRGEILGIIGRNGAGKSTLLKVLSRVTSPTSGEVRVKGRIASLLEVGTGFHPELTGRENTFLNGAILGMAKAEIKRKFDEIVAFSGVEQFIDTPVKRYSSGMYVRLAFAVAAHLEPEILIVDEVLAVGDAEFQKKCLGKMQDVSTREGRTVLFVSHNIRAVGALCTRAIYLASGSIKSLGTVTEQLDSYLHDSSSKELRLGAKPVNAGKIVQIDLLDFTPRPCKSCTKLDIDVRLSCSSPARISDVALLIYSRDETRVAVIDLRQRGLPYMASVGQFKISCSVDSLQLVAGEYWIGLYLKTNDFDGNILNLQKLIVTDVDHEEGYIPYDAAQRGFVEMARKVINPTFEIAACTPPATPPAVNCVPHSPPSRRN